MNTFSRTRLVVSQVLLIAVVLLPMSVSRAQDPVTGAIEGYVFDSATKAPIADALVQFVNVDSGATLAKRTNSQGYYRQGLLPPGDYRIRVSKPGYTTPSDQVFTNFATRANSLRPPFYMTTETAAAVTATPEPSPGQGQTGKPVSSGAEPTSETSIASEMNITDARRGGAYTDKEVSTLPLGSTTLTRSFDELGLLAPGVAPPPQTESDIAGPGVGPSVGSAGQFAVNGMRSRANNFTVDGSDNNDEDIGVRRQGFFSLVPQPVESIKEFQITTLLAPAQFGRNFGAQVNALSKSGGNTLHGTIFGFFNSSQLNSRNFFDTTNGNGTSSLTARTRVGGTTFTQPVLLNGAPLRVTNQSGGEDSMTLAQGGFVLGGPIKKDKTFFFLSYEKEVLNASKEQSFAVPTVERRGIFNTGATGLFADCGTPAPGFGVANCTPTNSANFFPEFGFPATTVGDAIFSLFPFPNNPTGVYGLNTFTEILPASARGNIASAKIDQKFNLWGKSQTLTSRYNFTQDWRDIPVTGGALFSSLRPHGTTHNVSAFLAGTITNSLSNVLRLSYGRTSLNFQELRDPFLIPSQISPNEPFLLNAPRLFNNTLNPLPVLGGPFGFTGVANTGPVIYASSGTTECGTNCSFFGTGRIGQVKVSGFSPIGVDVNYFPQSRVNTTYQLADTMNYRIGGHTLAFGEDVRRVELDSSLPRNARTLLTFNGAPEFDFNTFNFTGNFFSGADLVAAAAPTGAFLSLARTDSAIALRYYELNFFGQDEWRIHPRLSLSFGLRYEYNTPPKEKNNVIERTFSDPALNNANVAGLRTFLEGRTKIYDPDQNNFEPRIGIAWSPTVFGQNRSTVIRAGFGLFHDQVLGAVVSQSRNVFPNFVTVNTGLFDDGSGFLTYFNPSRGGINTAGGFVPLVQNGTLNALNPNLTLAQVLNTFASGAFFPNAISVTLPERRLKTPSAEQYSAMIEQQLSSSLILSVAYVGTRGHNLLRASTPNLGADNSVFPIAVFAGFDDPDCFPVITAFCTTASLTPSFSAFSGPPGNASTNFDRPIANIGPVLRYESSGRSRYDALQVQLRGRFKQGLHYQASYTFGKAQDDASDMFDLAGAPALPQNSLTRAGEFGLSNFDSRRRITYNVIYDFPKGGSRSSLYRTILGGLQIASTGSLQSGQPFTINSIFDVNNDGNLTDRLNTTQGIIVTGDRRQPIALQTGISPSGLLAAVGEDGAVGRNTFRAGSILNLDLAVVKNIAFSESRRLTLRMDIFNFINRANFGIPVRFLESPSFGQATSTVTPGRRIQFGLKFSF